MLPRKATSDRALLRAAAGGDAEAFGVFYRRYCDLLTSYLLRRVRTPELAADLMMEAFAAALLSVREDNAARARDPAAWLFGIARNKMVDAYRRGQAEDRARRRLGIEPVELEDDDIARINALSHEDVVQGLLRNLPAAQRHAVLERVLGERSYEAIAEDLACSELVVRKQVSRGLRRMRTAIEDCP